MLYKLLTGSRRSQRSSLLCGITNSEEFQAAQYTEIREFRDIWTTDMHRQKRS